ncbi:peroxisome proliferator-activated receptor gamma coactivator-related protein 1 [Carcharodon carcharias]|uniref:peroxisome proliferator-activated receptor gamma coactivator-related protein 1 n=1 Tax=Carcharodon carcharias TaxID=13397 RepID=UPI001B7F3B28|nr:peroxisome proliferator-activated receptor gamma coactivator-related protein 1 [Carcharodon carcharias]
MEAPWAAGAWSRRLREADHRGTECSRPESGSEGDNLQDCHSSSSLPYLTIAGLETTDPETGGILGSFSSYIDQSIISIIEDTSQTEIKPHLDEENEATLLTALTEILDTFDDENASPFDSIPDSEIFALPKGELGCSLVGHQSYAMLPDSGKEPCGHLIPAAVKGPNALWRSEKPVSRSFGEEILQQRSDGEEEEEEEDLISNGQGISESGSELLHLQAVEQLNTAGLESNVTLVIGPNLPCGYNVEHASLSDLVKYIQPYCLPNGVLCLETSTDSVGSTIELEVQVVQEGELPMVLCENGECLMEAKGESGKGRDAEESMLANDSGPENLPQTSKQQEALPAPSVHLEDPPIASLRRRGRPRKTAKPTETPVIGVQQNITETPRTRSSLQTRLQAAENKRKSSTEAQPLLAHKKQGQMAVPLQESRLLAQQMQEMELGMRRIQTRGRAAARRESRQGATGINIGQGPRKPSSETQSTLSGWSFSQAEEEAMEPHPGSGETGAKQAIRPEQPLGNEPSLTPRATESAPTPWATESSPAPRATESAPTPRATESAPAPRATESSPTPRATESSPTPRATEPSPTPRATEPSPTPRAAEPSPTPRAAEPSPTPRAAEPSPTPRAAEPSPTPRAAEPSPTPRAAEPSPTPRAAEPSPTPRAAEPSPTPRAAEPSPTPRAAEPSPTPRAAEPSPTPRAAEPSPTPRAAEPSPTPRAAEPSPTPRAAEPSPTPRAAEPSPTPRAAEPSPTPRAAEPSPTPRAAEPSPTPRAAEPSPTPRAAEPSPTPRAAEPSPTPRAAEPSPTPTPRATEPSPTPTPRATEPTPTPPFPVSNSSSPTVLEIAGNEPKLRPISLEQYRLRLQQRKQDGVFSAHEKPWISLDPGCKNAWPVVPIQSIVHGELSVLPLETTGHVVNKQSKRHNGQPLSPPAQTLAPPAQTLAPPAQTLAPPAQTLAPPAQTLAPPAQTLAPPAQTLAPPAQTLAPPAQTLAPPAQTLAPPAQTLAPPAQTLAPPAQTLAPPAQTLAPPAQTLAPPAQTLAPPAQTLAPPAQTLAPPAQTLAPPAQTLAPPILPQPIQALTSPEILTLPTLTPPAQSPPCCVTQEQPCEFQYKTKQKVVISPTLQRGLNPLAKTQIPALEPWPVQATSVQTPFVQSTAALSPPTLIQVAPECPSAIPAVSAQLVAVRTCIAAMEEDVPNPQNDLLSAESVQTSTVQTLPVKSAPVQQLQSSRATLEEEKADQGTLSSSMEETRAKDIAKGIEAADLMSLLEQFEVNEVTEEPPLGNSSGSEEERKQFDHLFGAELASTAGLTPPATPPHQIWKSLPAAGFLGKRKFQGSAEPSPGSQFRTVKLIEPKRLPQNNRSKCLSSESLQPATKTSLTASFGFGDHVYCLPRFSSQSSSHNICLPVMAQPDVACRWNVKHQASITIKPITSWNRQCWSPTHRVLTAEEQQASDPGSDGNTTDSQETTQEDRVSSSTLPNGTTSVEPDSCLQDRRNVGCDTTLGLKGGSCAMLSPCRNGETEGDKPFDSPHRCSRTRTSTRYRRQRYHSSSSSTSRSRSHSPVQKRRRYCRRRSRHSRHSSRSDSRSSSRSKSCSRSNSRSDSGSRSRSSRRRSVRMSYFTDAYDSYTEEPRNQYSRQEARAQKSNRRELAIEERRVVYVGKIRNGMMREELRRRFEVFGEIEDCNIYFRNEGDNYGFVTYRYTCDAFAAIENGQTLRKPDELPFDLCFGGRRQFCKTNYADLDSSHADFNSYSTKSKFDSLDFDTLLKQAKRSLRR